MKTEFTAEQLADPATAVSSQAIRKCVHCGFCTATCPTYVLDGDERDSPRGRIYLIKDMLERDAAPTADVVRHIDRCLSCLACTTTCPSGVDYRHLVDHARAYVEARYRRPLPERVFRTLLAWLLPHRGRFSWALRLGALARPFAPLVAGLDRSGRLATMLELVPRRRSHGERSPRVRMQAPHPDGPRRGRVLLLQGCAEPVLLPSIRAATVRLLERLGYAVEFAAGEGCCGALVHHLGREHDGLAYVRRNLDAWRGRLEEGGVDAILATASGCGSQLKDYGFLLRNDPDYAPLAARAAALARDLSELVEGEAVQRLKVGVSARIAYHAACSLQHGQKIVGRPRALLEAAGFTVIEPAESHLCCGSAGTYNILQPRIAARLGRRKAERLAACQPDAIATGNVGCAVQIGRFSGAPVLHVAELLDWATGGPPPDALHSAMGDGAVATTAPASVGGGHA
ncbi:glycolate oxidase subunit GlcF [Bradyrhizobium sp.]|uniref:glycolate oxidase subunit GlcF n=1 Tax=Bradyrhizobium sp. TaxID=376 RepID=UPI00261243C1|nr:glycolate oxidase subunit GlcF [Bradyrhizobium sp.]